MWTIKLTCFFVVCIAACQAIIGGARSRIVPYQIGITVNGRFACSGVIIGENIALTSALCVQGVQASAVSARAGTEVRSSGREYRVSSITTHEQYSSVTFDYDIAVLRMATNFEFSASIAAIALPSVDETIAVGSIANITGWGIDTIGSTAFAGTIQVISVPIVPTSTCRADLWRINHVTDRMLCAGDTIRGVSVCAGDIGGPLVYASKLVGLASWGPSCGSMDGPVVYTRIAALRQWITAQTGI